MKMVYKGKKYDADDFEMVKIIDGKVYSTISATWLGHSESDCGRGDFNYYTEDFYRTPRGRYFLHGEGGPLSGYSVSCGDNSWSGGEKIIPLSEEEARDWAERNMSAQKYIEIFGEPEEA